MDVDGGAPAPQRDSEGASSETPASGATAAAASPSSPSVMQQAHAQAPPTPNVSVPDGPGSASQPKVGAVNAGSLLGFRAADLKKALYDPNAKLVDLFGDLEPKLMLDSIMDTFWESWLQ